MDFQVYVNSKLERLYNENDNGYYRFLKLVERIITNTEYCIDYYSSESAQIYNSRVWADYKSSKTEKGLYVHVINVDINLSSFQDEIDKIMSISGEICVSDLVDNQFSTRNSKIALILSGTPTHSFPCDVWSYQITKGKFAGKRGMTRDVSCSDRNESWIIPSHCKLWGIAYDRLSKHDSQIIEKFCFKNGVNSLHCFEALNKKEEEVI